MIGIRELIWEFDPITLGEMDGVKLMNRTDTKFMIHINQLLPLLRDAKANYRVVEIENERILEYSSVYLDTENLAMYTMHHNQKLNRYKIRLRQYVKTGFSFLEIKTKNNKGKTSKKRREISQTEYANLNFSDDKSEFIRSKTPFDLSELKPAMKSQFQRMTFVDRKKSERITIDINLNFFDAEGETKYSAKDLVVIEIKRETGQKSDFENLLREMRVKTGFMSKYCFGMALLHPEIKQNSFKKKIRRINKLTNKYEYDTNRFSRV